MRDPSELRSPNWVHRPIDRGLMKSARPCRYCSRPLGLRLGGNIAPDCPRIAPLRPRGNDLSTIGVIHYEKRLPNYPFTTVGRRVGADFRGGGSPPPLNFRREGTPLPGGNGQFL